MYNLHDFRFSTSLSASFMMEWAFILCDLWANMAMTEYYLYLEGTCETFSMVVVHLRKLVGLK